MFKVSSNLTHNYSYFTKAGIVSSSKKYDIPNLEALETHLWVYELHSQIQKRSGSNCILKGGACAQLYIPLQFQRCTSDLDVSTNLNAHQLEEILKDIRQNFNSSKLYSNFQEYIPTMVKINGKTIPMATYLFTLPFVFKKPRKKRIPSIKIDFLFTDVNGLSKHSITAGETIGLKLNYSPICLSPNALIADKLIIFAADSIGLEKYKVQSFYKNIYDLYYLINTFNDLDNLISISTLFQTHALHEFEIKKMQPFDVDAILDDILHNLYYFSTIDLDKNFDRPNGKLIRLEKELIQGSIKADLSLDSWSIMCMYLYIWTYALKSYKASKDYSALKAINEIINKYDYYLSLDKNNQNQLISHMRSEITSIDSDLYLNTVKDPLRIIYLNTVLSGI